MQKTLLTLFRLYFRYLFRLSPGVAARHAFALFSTPLGQKTRSREQDTLAMADQETIAYRGRSIQVYRWGNGPRKALLVHGWAGNAGQLGRIAGELAGQGFMVVGFDGPGHGRSSGRLTNAVDFSGLIARLIEREWPVDLLVGHSFGSATSVLALAENPELVVDRLVLFSSPDRLEDILGDFATLMQLPEEMLPTMIAYLERRFGRSIGDFEVSRRALETGVRKALVIHDKGDRVIPYPVGRRIAYNWPEAQFLSSTGLGHYRVLWDRGVIERILEFAAVGVEADA